MFRDRRDAGRKLAERLTEYRGADAVLLALPRGGVVLGAELARSFKLPLDILSIRKVGHPDNPEYALCAVDARGMQLCNEDELKSVGRAWFTEALERERREAQRREELYRGGRAAVELTGKTAIIVDDGIATGLTMRLAVRSARTQGAARVIAAVPVASREASEEVRREAGMLIVLEPPEQFLGAVGAHYKNFEQVADSEVIALLRQ